MAPAQPPPPPPSSPPKPPPPPSSSSPSSGNLSSIPINAVDSAPMQSGNGFSSVHDIATVSHNRDDVPVSDELLSSKDSVVQDLPPPPPKPADEKIVRNIEVLCQFIAKNGLGFEEMARQNESENPEFIFLFGGEPGSEALCAHEYYLWMKKKCCLVSGLHEGQGGTDLSQRHLDEEPSGNPNSASIVETTHSPVDSDVDMEDDITQTEKEPGVHNSVEDFEPGTVLTGDMLEIQKQENELLYTRDSTLALNLSPSVKLQSDAEKKPEQSCIQADKIDSPIRLIQNYASDDSSDDDGVPFHEEAKTMADSPPHKSGSTSSHEDMVYCNKNSRSGTVSESGLAESVRACNESVLTKDLDDSDAVLSGVQDKVHEASSPGKNVHDRTDRDEATSPDTAIEGKYASESSVFDTTSTCKEIEKEQKKNTSTELKVDEFGRLVKQGASESESDDSRHMKRRGRRGRSRSHSRSPSDRRRRGSPRWSSRRRKDRRSRSRSWSPKRRRSRSRSPYRPGGDVGSEKPRRDKDQTRQCFDFLKGRCYRGASCRYLHHELDNRDSSRRFKSKHHQPEVVPSSRNSGFHGGDISSRLIQQNNEVKGEKMDLHLDKHDTGDLSSKINDEISKAESVHDAVQPALLHKGDETFVTVTQKCEVATRGDSQFQEASDEPICHPPTGEEAPISGMDSTNEQVIHHSQAEASETQKLDSAAKVDDSSTIQTPAVSLCEVPVSEPYLGNMSNLPAGSSDPTPNFPNFTHLPAPHLLPQATNAPQGSNQVDQKSIAPAVSFPPQPVPVGNVHAYQAPLSNQQLQYPMPPNPSWNILPPLQPRPPYITEPSIPGAPLQFQQFQQGNLSLRNDFPNQSSLRTQPGEFPSHSQVGGLQHQPYHMHSSNLPTQPFAGYSQFPSQGLAPSSSYASGSVPPQPIPFPGDSTIKSMQSFPGESLPFSEPSKPTFQNHSYPQQRPSPYGPQLTAADSTSSHLGGSLTASGYTSDPLNRDHSARFLDMGGSKISAHYNPYASTFDQPLSSRFGSAAGNKYDSSFNLDHASRAAGQTLPQLGGDQYDPLFDSIEPSSGSFKKHAQKQDHAADNSDIMKKLSSNHKVLDVEENNKQKEVGVVGATMSLENDEYGETADAEVGAVENGSPSDPDEDAMVAEGEIEIDQVKLEGKSKKSKDSRSMKLFKIAVANFVKEVLKPQWRQGNMSKEVFKTIVKKTVDKVSGAMKNHRVPKSQAKIDHYIDSSRRKLTQLVEGYVSKYKS